MDPAEEQPAKRAKTEGVKLEQGKAGPAEEEDRGLAQEARLAEHTQMLERVEGVQMQLEAVSGGKGALGVEQQARAHAHARMHTRMHVCMHAEGAAPPCSPCSWACGLRPLLETPCMHASACGQGREAGRQQGRLHLGGACMRARTRTDSPAPLVPHPGSSKTRRLRRCLLWSGR